MVIRNFPDGGPPPFGFGETGNSAIRSAVPENHTLGSNTKSIGRPVPEIWPVGRWSSIYTLFLYTPLRYVRNVAREE